MGNSRHHLARYAESEGDKEFTTRVSIANGQG